MTEHTRDEETRDAEYLIGIRLRDTSPAEDYKLVEDVAPSVGDIVVVETATGTAIGEVRRPRRALPDFKRDRLFRRVVRPAGGKGSLERCGRQLLRAHH